MNASNKLLSDLIAYRTYAKYLPHLERRESLEETINRTMNMHLGKFPKLSKEIVKSFGLVHDLKVLPSMRAMQFAGDAILKNNARQYNCSFTHIKTVRIFSEILFLLLSGCGVGYSVQRRHTGQLPKVGVPREEGIFYVQDSISGWAQALHALMEAYFYNGVRPIFDFSKVRPKGAPLFTSGAKAPGPEPLKLMLEQVEARLKAATGRQLRPIEVHDIVCMISDCVLAGGIRRAALIALFDRNDEEMLRCKHGNWWEKHPYRARANNSAILPRGKVTKEEFDYIYKMCQESGSGEPGFLWVNNEDDGANPCVEIGMYTDQFCNLTSVNQTGIKSKADFLKRIIAASTIGTIQAAYTDFPYLSPSWKETTEGEALIGVSFTGIADNGDSIPNEWLQEGASLVLDVNEQIARKLGINVAARATALKPEGSASCVLGSSSGIHDRHDNYYLRRFQINKQDDLYYYLDYKIPGLVEDYTMAANTAVITIPQEAPEGAITRDMTSAMDLFNRAMRYNKNWIAPGYRTGSPRHNVSCTISVKEHEWESLRDAMWAEREHYAGISLLPYDNSNYVQMPFESCTKEKYEELSKLVRTIDFREIREINNSTNLIETVACSGGACEIT